MTATVSPSPWAPPHVSELPAQGTVQITEAQAAALVHARWPGRPLPAPGHHMTLGLRYGLNNRPHWLRLWHWSGTYQLVCRSILPADWPKVFGLDPTLFDSGDSQ